ncbi:MAG: hypothetical protein WC394_02960, partial [Candidatus Omnitrophota bacterium]
MIVAMKKVFLVVQSKDADSSIKNLRGLGLLHVEHESDPKGQEIGSIQDRINLVNQVIGIVGNANKNSLAYGIKQKKQEDLKIIIQHVIDAHKRYEQLKEYSVTLKNRINQWE